MESFLLRRSVPKLVLGRLPERAQLLAIVERRPGDGAEVVAEGLAARGDGAESLEFLLNLA